MIAIEIGVNLDHMWARIKKCKDRNLTVMANKSEVTSSLLTESVDELSVRNFIRSAAINEAVAFVVYVNPSYRAHLDFIRQHYADYHAKENDDAATLVTPQFPSQHAAVQKTRFPNMSSIEKSAIRKTLRNIRDAYTMAQIGNN